MNDQLNHMLLERHSGSAANQRQLVELELEVTERDIQNMHSMKNDANALAERASLKYIGFDFKECLNWTLIGITAGARFNYRLENGGLYPDVRQGAQEFLAYLQLYEIDGRLREEFGFSPLAWPMIYLPVNRTSQGFTTEVLIHGFNEHEHKRMVDATSSKTATSIVNLAVGRIADKYHMLLQKDNGAALKTFREDPNLVVLTSILSELGYEWELDTVDFRKSHYDLKLKKQGASFKASAASSGEKELLTYLLVIFALNVKDALIIVDEPELHLHPRWQKTLLILFEKLAKETGNQFIFATHSPNFISSMSIHYVSRVFSRNQNSNIQALDTSNFPNAKSLLHIVNSQNNEKLFFADKVILVEGISDRIFFEALLKKLGKLDNHGTVIEILDVGGKGLFSSYTMVLDACGVPYSIIADLDYLNEIGSHEIKSLMKFDPKDFRKKVVNDVTSRDGDTLVAAIDKAMANGNWEHAADIWQYIKNSRIKLDTALTADQKDLINNFVDSKKQDRVYLLKLGNLESYLPEHMKGKDIEKLIEFLRDDSFWNQIENNAQTELTAIADAVTA
jgi:putative ATP-dependent endonuclease of the OLD family